MGERTDIEVHLYEDGFDEGGRAVMRFYILQDVRVPCTWYTLSVPHMYMFDGSTDCGRCTCVSNNTAVALIRNLTQISTRSSVIIDRHTAVAVWKPATRKQLSGDCHSLAGHTREKVPPQRWLRSRMPAASREPAR